MQDRDSLSSSLEKNKKIASLTEVERYIYVAAVLFVDGWFYVIGGVADGKKSNTIGRLDAMKHIWASSPGSLNAARRGNSAIYDGSNFIVVGDRDTQMTEKCSLSDNKMTCIEQTPELTDYYELALFLVPLDYCKDWPTFL